MRLAGLFVALGFALAACVGASNDDEDSSEDALTWSGIEAYAPVTPPDHRIVTADLPALVGAPVSSGSRVSVIRTLTFEGKSARLVVDVDRSTTALLEEPALTNASRPAVDEDTIDASPWERSLAELASSHRAMSSVDDGASFPAEIAEPFALTVDMCQSKKPWEERLFTWLVGLSDTIHEPVPVGIAMTGLWAQAHPGELDQLLGWQKDGKLAITWINHSSTHPLNCLDASCSHAEFLTAANVDFDEQVMGLERSLLSRGIAPSGIFRFPGLVHDEHRLEQLSRLSLLPLDANAWIAKGEPIRPRAVVLVHGNGNEPSGITGFLAAVKEPARAANLRAGTSKIVSPLLVAPVSPLR